jgi:hypothetical protein
MSDIEITEKKKIYCKEKLKDQLVIGDRLVAD